MNKIALPPLEFEEFNLVDILINQEISDVAYRARLDGGQRTLILLQRLRAVRAKIDHARPPQYAQAIRAQFDSVCD